MSSFTSGIFRAALRDAESQQATIVFDGLRGFAARTKPAEPRLTTGDVGKIIEASAKAAARSPFSRSSEARSS